MLNNFLAQHSDSLAALTHEQVSALEAHLSLLERWNRTINLTAIKKQDEAIRKHIGESLFLAFHLPPEALRICDLGSGGGFPGIPVAIARPNCKVTLVESDVRKSVFLREASRKLPNVSVLTQRFEALDDEFDWIIARAVNLSKTTGGPVSPRIAFLGASLEESRSQGAKRSLANAYRWQSIALPWDPRQLPLPW